ncbi:MAG TPA: NfeD family protein [Ktedonobacterales bacterium]|nr:NfeD family protein [Ktedonobacterales bacterium]
MGSASTLLPSPQGPRRHTSHRWSRARATLALVALLALAPAIAIITTIAAPAAHAAAPHIDTLSFARDVDPAGARAVADAIDAAEHDGATLLVITVDTPGGDIDSMQKIVQAELSATIPIVTYVSPQAAQAASAGAFVTLAAPIVAMAPSTRIGAASPVDAAGNDLPATLKSKVEQDLEALMRSIQTDYHRNVAPAEVMISNATAYTDGEAMSQGIISLQADSLSALLGQLDGYTGVYANGDTFTLRTAGLAILALQPSVASEIETVLFDPTVLFILFVVAAICIYLELAHPGATVPGVVGAIALVTFLIGSVGISPNWGGLALMLLAVLLLAVDTRAPTHGALTLGALISLVAGALIFFDTGSNVGAATVNPSVIVGVTAGVGLVALLVLRYSVGAQLRRVTTGKESYVGQTVTVIEPLAPVGRVSLLGENWSARLSSAAKVAEPVPVGAHARIVRVEGLTLIVEPAPAPVAPTKPGSHGA